MSFIVDRQTQDDLGLFGSNQKQSIFGLFNRTHTRGGAEVLKRIFSFPLSDASQINARSETITYLQHHLVSFPFKGEWFDAAEFYLNQADERVFQVDKREAFHNKLKSYIGGNSAMDAIAVGIDGLRQIVLAFDALISSLGEGSPFLRGLATFRDKPFFQFCLDEIPSGRIGLDCVNRYDERLRRDSKKEIDIMLNAVYELDCFLAVAAVANEYGFVAASAIDSEENLIDIKGVCHPLLLNAVPNDIHISSSENVVFDELFKGTNVKDAFNGTLAIAGGFSSYTTCTFLLSTHITEAAGALNDVHKNILFYGKIN